MRRPSSRRNADNYPAVPPGTRIYAIGDVHGCADLLEQTFFAIDHHRRANPIANPIEIMLGDYVDRGPRSAQVVELLTARSVRGRTICLMGNPRNISARVLEESGLTRRVAALRRSRDLDVIWTCAFAQPDFPRSKKLAASLAKRLPAHHRNFLMKFLRVLIAAITFSFTRASDPP